jgi:hypothetical protein
VQIGKENMKNIEPIVNGNSWEGLKQMQKTTDEMGRHINVCQLQNSFFLRAILGWSRLL